MCERWYGRLLQRISRRQPIIIGEWSVVLKGESLERYSGDEAWALMQKFGQAQLAVYEQHALAWFYWNYKTEGRGIWNFRSLVEDGFLELPPRK
jgi:aryl-phospho-beta-D-glucosidase BglC (GH1 family)